jgi:hypothetical protein
MIDNTADVQDLGNSRNHDIAPKKVQQPTSWKESILLCTLLQVLNCVFLCSKCSGSKVVSLNDDFRLQDTALKTSKTEKAKGETKKEKGEENQQ